MIKAGTQFPSYAYIDEGTEAFYVTTEEVVFKNVGAENGDWAREYLATFVADGAVVAYVAYAGDTINEPAVPEKEGYEGKWKAYTLNGDVTIEAVDPSGNRATKIVSVIVTAEEPACGFVTDEGAFITEYTVTFDGENPVTVKEGFRVSKPEDPVKETDEKAKYTFIGWYNGDVEWDFDNDVVTEDVELVSRWKESKRSYYVTFDGANRVKLDYGSLITADNKPTDPVKKSDATHDYVFDGWYVNGVKWDFETDVVKGETKLISQFTAVERTFTVTFDGKNAQEYKYGDKIVKPADPVREGDADEYIFGGWVYKVEMWDFENDVVKEDMNLVSSWAAVTFGDEDEKPSEDEMDSTTPPQTDDSSEKTPTGFLAGCSGVMGGGMAIAALGVAALTLLKKKED